MNSATRWPRRVGRGVGRDVVDSVPILRVPSQGVACNRPNRARADGERDVPQAKVGAGGTGEGHRHLGCLLLLEQFISISLMEYVFKRDFCVNQAKQLKAYRFSKKILKFPCF